MAQPSLSQIVRNLEKNLRTELFYRGQSLVPPRAGER
ncbi:LysR family transcriptional regulator [Streptomyces sp. NBC_00063]